MIKIPHNLYLKHVEQRSNVIEQLRHFALSRYIVTLETMVTPWQPCLNLRNHGKPLVTMIKLDSYVKMFANYGKSLVTIREPWYLSLIFGGYGKTLVTMV